MVQKNGVLVRFGGMMGVAQIPLILGLLLMAIAVPLVTKLAEKNTENRGRAAENLPCWGGTMGLCKACNKCPDPVGGCAKTCGTGTPTTPPAGNTCSGTCESVPSCGTVGKVSASGTCSGSAVCCGAVATSAPAPTATYQCSSTEDATHCQGEYYWNGHRNCIGTKVCSVVMSPAPTEPTRGGWPGATSTPAYIKMNLQEIIDKLLQILRGLSFNFRLVKPAYAVGNVVCETCNNPTILGNVTGGLCSLEAIFHDSKYVADCTVLLQACGYVKNLGFCKDGVTGGQTSYKCCCRNFSGVKDCGWWPDVLNCADQVYSPNGTTEGTCNSGTPTLVPTRPVGGRDMSKCGRLIGQECCPAEPTNHIYSPYCEVGLACVDSKCKSDRATTPDERRGFPGATSTPASGAVSSFCAGFCLSAPEFMKSTCYSVCKGLTCDSPNTFEVACTGACTSAGLGQCVSKCLAVKSAICPVGTAVPTNGNCKSAGVMVSSASECCNGSASYVSSGLMCDSCKANGVSVSSASDCCSGYAAYTGSALTCGVKPGTTATAVPTKTGGPVGTAIPNPNPTAKPGEVCKTDADCGNPNPGLNKEGCAIQCAKGSGKNEGDRGVLDCQIYPPVGKQWDVNYTKCIAEGLPTSTTGGGSSKCSQCPSDFKCYKNGETGQVAWFVTGYAQIGFVADNDQTCAAVAKPSFKGRNRGDADCNGLIDINDRSLWTKEYVESKGQTTRDNWLGDFDCNGVVDINDRSIWTENYVSTKGRM